MSLAIVLVLKLSQVHQVRKFFVTAMAGNIVPAIATTNAVIAGLIVMEGLKVLAGDFGRCKTVSNY